jgi:hypothetical protein
VIAESVRRRWKAVGYIDGFYKTLEKPAEIKKAFMGKCLKRGLT